MLFFSRWKVLAVLLTAIVVCLCAVPNFVPESVVQRWPKWAQRHVVLGLDLQGGSHILLQVDANDVRRQKVETLRDDVRRVLREARIANTNTVRGDTIEVKLRDPNDTAQALAKLRDLSQPIGGVLGTGNARSVDIVDVGGGTIRLTVTEAAMIERTRQTIEQSIQIIEHRVNDLGTVEPTIQRQGADRILVQVPGLQDPKRLIEILGKTARLDFRMVDQSVTPEQALQTRPPPESEILYGQKDKQPYL